MTDKRFVTDAVTTNTFTDAQGRRYIAGHEVPEDVWTERESLALQLLACLDTIDALKEALGDARASLCEDSCIRHHQGHTTKRIIDPLLTHLREEEP